MPDEKREAAYADTLIELGHGRVVLDARTLSKMLQALDVQPDELDIALDELETRLERLRSLYQQYFLGIDKRSPEQQRSKFTTRMRKLVALYVPQTDLRYRLNGIASRFNSYCGYWDRIQRLIDDMFETMVEYSGVGLAAPQVGVETRLTVIDPTAGEDPVIARRGAGSSLEASRNAGIWPRVTGSSGQYRSLSGGLQPLVMPATARRSMFAAKTESSVSVKPIGTASGSFTARSRNAAIWPRVTGSPFRTKTSTTVPLKAVLPVSSATTAARQDRRDRPTARVYAASARSA